jgi:hypothetical protein
LVIHGSSEPEDFYGLQQLFFAWSNSYHIFCYNFDRVELGGTGVYILYSESPDVDVRNVSLQ